MRTEVSDSSGKLAREGKANRDTSRFFQNDKGLSADGEEPAEEAAEGKASESVFQPGSSGRTCTPRGEATAGAGRKGWVQIRGKGREQGGSQGFPV